MDILQEAKRLYELGAAVHWIRSNSKVPVKAGWNGPKRDPWTMVEKDYQEGYGLGIRLGESSKLQGGYLANIDVDIKSSHPKHAQEALEFVREQFPNLLTDAPLVKTGYGYRYFIKTPEPYKSGRLGSSSEEAVVFMPTAEVSKQQLKAMADGKITQEALDKGYRVRPAWEIDFMSQGKQVLIPPTIHPETKKPYIWERPLLDVSGLPIINGLKGYGVARTVKSETLEDFTVSEVDLINSKLSDRIVGMIINGEGVDNRSEALLSVCIPMLKCGFTTNEIATVLTDKDNFLGRVAYDHRETKSRANAADWIISYTIPKAKAITDASAAFNEAVEVLPTLDTKEALAQAKALIERSDDWKCRIKRAGKEGDGNVQKSLENITLILTHAISPIIFKRNLFNGEDFFGVDTPWGGKAGDDLTDDSIIQIIYWLGQKYNFEPQSNMVISAARLIAIKNGFNPVKDELEALPPWDGIKRLDDWLKKYFNAQGSDEYLAQVFRKWMVASITRTYEPGTKFDWFPILQGKQKAGKSSFGKILFGEEYYRDWLPDLADKDAAIALSGYRCIEFGELASLNRNEIETAKSFITREKDHVRPAFHPLWVKSKRQCVFLGTTNKDEHLTDDTGNRRFRTVVVGDLNFDALKRDREQLWAEAFHIYNCFIEGTLELTGEAEIFANELQAEKMVLDESAFMEEAFASFLEKEKLKAVDERFDLTKFKLVLLFNSGGPFDKFNSDMKNLRMAGKALRKCGGLKLAGKDGKWWTLPEKYYL